MNTTTECEYCATEIGRKDNMARHMNDACHVGVGAGARVRVPCPDETCTRDYANRSAMLVHFKAAHGFNLHRCEEEGCYYLGNTLSNLIQHIKRHHEVSDYSCDLVRSQVSGCRFFSPNGCHVPVLSTGAGTEVQVPSRYFQGPVSGRFDCGRVAQKVAAESRGMRDSRANLVYSRICVSSISIWRLMSS